MITILQQPTYPNGSQNSLMYAISSSNASKPQYRYLVDVYFSGSNELLSRLKLYPNEVYSGITDLAPLFNDYLKYDNQWKSDPLLFATQSFRSFELKIGEQYAASTSGSPELFPAIISQSYARVMPSVIDNNTTVTAPTFNILSEDPTLTNTPFGLSDYRVPITVDDFHTLSLYTNSGSNQVNSVYAQVYNGESSIGDQEIISLADIEDPRVWNIGVGPQNLMLTDQIFIDAFTQDWTHYIVTLIREDDNILRPRIRNYFFENTTGCYDKTRFAFINRYGFFDYYNINLPYSKDTKITRKTFTNTFNKFNGLTSPKDLSNRGKTQYNLSTEDKFKITTNYLPQDEADWLTELFESPSVYQQIGDEFIPIVLTSADYKWKTNPRGQKLFQYNIEWEMSNNRQPRT